MLLKAEKALHVRETMDLFDSPFVHPAFVTAADGRICAGPVRQIVQGGYHFTYEVKRAAPALGARYATLWGTGYGPCGGCFLGLDRRQQRNKADFRAGLEALVAESGADFLIWPYFPIESREYQWLGNWMDDRLRGREAALVRRVLQRAFLDCRAVEEAGSAGLSLSRNKRKVIGRQTRRLEEMGSVQYVSTRDGLDHEAALEHFLKVEASGWKARKGTALSVVPALDSFAHEFVLPLLAEGRARIDLMMLDDHCIAGLVSLQAGRGLFSWKTGMDEVYKRFSPGVHILHHISQLAIADPDIDYIDSLADAGHPVAEHIWGGMRTYAQLFLPLNAHGSMGALSYSAAADSKQQARYWAKRMLGRS